VPAGMMKREYTEQPKNKSRFVVSLALDGYRIAQNCAGVGVYFFPPPPPPPPPPHLPQIPHPNSYI